MPHCDFLAFHCVSTPQTRKMLNAARIALLPDGAIVVNAAGAPSSTTTRSSRR